MQGRYYFGMRYTCYEAILVYYLHFILCTTRKKFFFPFYHP